MKSKLTYIAIGLLALFATSYVLVQKVEKALAVTEIARTSSSTKDNNDTSENNTYAGMTGTFWVYTIIYDNSKTLNSATLNGNAMTIQTTQNTTANGYKISILTVSGVTLTAQNAAVVLSFSSTPSYWGASHLIGYTGVDSVDDVEGSVTSGTTHDLTLTTTGTNNWLVGGEVNASSVVNSAGTNFVATAGPTNWGIRAMFGDTNTGMGAAGAKTFGVNSASNTEVAFVAISLKAASDPPAATSTFQLNQWDDF